MEECKNNIGAPTKVVFVKLRRATLYPLVRKNKLTHEKISKAFGYENVNSFRCSSAHKRIMNGVENILTLLNEI